MSATTSAAADLAHPVTSSDVSGTATAASATTAAPEVVDTPSSDQSEPASDVDDPEAQRLSDENVTKVKHWHETTAPTSHEFFVVALLVVERPEYRSHYGDPEPFNNLVAVNRTLDGAIESAVGELVSRDVFETLMTEELQWSEEFQE